MNKLNEIIEKENLTKDSNSLKEMSEQIIKAHKGYKREMVKQDIKNTKMDFSNFIMETELSSEELIGARKFLLFMLKNINI